MKVTYDTLVEFYDPHPGLAGARAPIPPRVKEVADHLDGQRLTIGEAVRRIEAVTGGTVEAQGIGQNILLFLRVGVMEHCWEVIRFRKVPDSFFQ